jgi:phosphate starvation-inducible PhoH-like protein
MVVTGDLTQIDLPSGKRSGLNEAVDVLRGVEGISFVYFDDRDVVRHPLVQRIVKAYERYQEMTGMGRQLALKLTDPASESAAAMAPLVQNVQAETAAPEIPLA